MSCTYSKLEIEQIRKELKQRLSQKRFEHSCKTAEVALKYAKEVGYDENKAEIAALLHDVAREYTTEQIIEIVDKYNVKLNKYNQEYLPSVHGVIGAIVAENEFGVKDQEILLSIKNHITGRPCMKTLEKIIYLADHLGRVNDPRAEEARLIKNMPLDDAIYQVMRVVIQYDVENGKTIDERTAQTFDWLLDEVNNIDKKEHLDIERNKFFERIDQLIVLYKDHMISGFPAKNMRDLGGYQTIDGHFIKKNMILRSGRLDQFSKSDFEKLLAMGINYVVDLRTDFEKTRLTKETIAGIHFVDVPFDVSFEYKSYLDSLVEWYERCDDSKEAAWLAAKYFNSVDIDEMYRTLMFDNNSQIKYKTILEIMMRTDCTGVVFYCNAGKDRTGIIASVIMNVLGVSGNVAHGDYMASQIPNLELTMDFVEQLKNEQFNIKTQNKAISVLGVESKRPERMNEEILKRYNNYANYFDINNYFSVEQIQRFRDKYLEKGYE